MLRWSFNLLEEADIIENSVESIINEGVRTKDLSSPGEKSMTTKDVGDIVYQRIIKS